MTDQVIDAWIKTHGFIVIYGVTGLFVSVIILLSSTALDD
jgi:hypothetical protein